MIMSSFFVYESKSYVSGITFTDLNYGTATSFTSDLIDSCVLTKHPDLVDYGEYEASCLSDSYYPISEDISTCCYDEYSIEQDYISDKIANKYHKRKNDTEYINILHSLENIFGRIISKYEEGWCVNEKGIAVSNYCSSPVKGNSASFELEPFPEAKNMNPDAFKVVEYFMRMQKLRINWKIPEEIKLFIEKHEAKELLRG